MDPEKVSSLQEQAARSLFEAVNSLDEWQSAEFRFEIVGGYASEATLVDGDPNIVSAPIDIGGWLYELRTEMATPSGPWFTCTLSLTPSGEFGYNFDYDTEPKWDGGPRPSDDEYERDLQEFPRSQEDVPEWFPSNLSERS
ncbi:hypothetical protein [Tsukamurella paurometabola]|uniref:DUF600 family protein n=1 Tax=Tsukamurella paurometabola TaxID=2061 RepID=A0A3P8KDN5_TSUPA|nr:hypothetical protein [Tsukamurella paurometabola]UEA85161.1 hypothetical protein LK411_10255 [Tsukamurella paurometabola]VDR37768.1 Uncharacterised protein [Tsukamurella paurometabola]